MVFDWGVYRTKKQKKNQKKPVPNILRLRQTTGIWNMPQETEKLGKNRNEDGWQLVLTVKSEIWVFFL